MIRLGQGIEGDVRRRPVQEQQRFGQRGQVRIVPQGRRQQFGQRQAAGLQMQQRLFREVAPAQLVNAFGGRIDGGQALLHRYRLVAVHAAKLRMHHLQPHRAPAHFAETTQLGATRQHLLLAGIEMKEAQGDEAGTVGQAREQHAPASELHLGQLHGAHDDRFAAGPQGADGRDPGAILVAQGQMEQQIRDLTDPQLRQLLGHARSHALQRGHGHGGRFSRHGWRRFAAHVPVAFAGDSNRISGRAPSPRPFPPPPPWAGPPRRWPPAPDRAHGNTRP